MRNTGHWRTPKEIFARVLSLSLRPLARPRRNRRHRHCCHGSCRSSLLCTRFVRLKSGFCWLVEKAIGNYFGTLPRKTCPSHSSFFSRFPRACWIRQIVLQSVTDLVGLVSSQATSCWINLGTPQKKRERERATKLNFTAAAFFINNNGSILLDSQVLLCWMSAAAFP